ncbi:ketopantoate hydroxymethyltransferase [Thelephora terrestris]|uniref:3-methyl-2-oxobutanoate hydroxymethyltransferase n=1 Tax=Thelephora terrestris TaxID=56493 RepID=A0A9P6H340_9AGAM|nr:ketopantoate hydroxymethyltransferase [Thelephora terrestris]
MSVRPQEPQAQSTRERKKVTIQTLQTMRDTNRPIAMLTAYDYPTGRACDLHGIDITLVGDSLAQVCLGYDSTTSLTLDEMIHHCRAVARGSKNPLLVADMPYGTYHTGGDDTVRNAIRMVREGGVEAVKMEGGSEVVDIIRRLTSFGVPVMGHVGLLPQRHTALSGYRVQGKDARGAVGLVRNALELEKAGVFSIVLEAIPHRLGELITRRLSVPTIGIGAGPYTSGQVLVWDDVMGTWSGHQAKFVRRFADVQSEAKRGVTGYAAAVRERSFPDVEAESYPMDDLEWQQVIAEFE